MELASAGIGGYIAGRLRTKWANVHTDEVYFRDTAHGLLVWSVGMVITVGFLASAAASFAGEHRPMNSGGFTQESAFDPNAYFVDTLLRGSSSTIEKPDTSERAEVSRTLAHD